jgi:hypothetical protein
MASVFVLVSMRAAKSLGNAATVYAAVVPEGA